MQTTKTSKYTKLAAIVLAAVLCITSLSFSVHAVSESTENAASLSRSTVISEKTIYMDLLTAPTVKDPSFSPLSMWNDIYGALDVNTNWYNDAKEEMETNLSAEQFATIVELVTEIEGLQQTLENKFADFEATYQSNGCLDAELYSEMLGAYYTFCYDRYNCVAEYTKNNGDTVYLAGSTLQNLFKFATSTPGYLTAGPYFNFYMNSPETLDKNSALLIAVYEELTRQLAIAHGLEAYDEKVTKEAFDLMDAEMRNWVKELAIDYITGYQAQVELYFTNTKELGYVFDLDTGHPALRNETTNYRELAFEDLLLTPVSTLSTEFFYMNLSDDKTGFKSPEEVYNSDEFSPILEQIFAPLGSLEYLGYSAQHIVSAYRDLVENEYTALYAPGSISQPVFSDFNTYMSIAYEIYDTTGEFPTLTSWIPEGDTTPVYDQYRHQNYMKIPTIAVKKEIVEEVTRTVHYLFEDGTTASEDVVEAVRFKTTKELYSGVVVCDPENESFAALEHPTVSYSDASATVLTPETSVPELVVQHDSEDAEITVVFPLEFKLKVSYVDENGNTLKDSIEINGRWNTSYSQTPLAIDGYEAVVPANASGVYGVNKDEIVFVYKKASITDSSDSTIPTNPNQPETPNSGDNSVIALWAIALFASLGAFLALVFFKRKNKQKDM